MVAETTQTLEVINMTFPAALVLTGGLIYSANDRAGALLIGVGCALALVRWLSDNWSWLRGK